MTKAHPSREGAGVGPRPPSLSAVFALLVGALASQACAVLPTTHLGSSIDGKDTGAARLVVGDETYHPTECYSGERESYFGVDLIDSARSVDLRVVFDPIEGVRLRFTKGQGPAFAERLVFSRPSCTTLEATIEPTGWSVNDLRDYSGRVELRCTSERGDVLEASIDFKHCH